MAAEVLVYIQLNPVFTETAAEFTELDTLNIFVYLLCFAHVLVILTKKKNLFVLRAHTDFGTLYVWTLLENSRSGLI